MTDTQQKYFMAVAEELNFSRAASKLYVSQPAVSKQIAALEAELGFSLFDRSDKNIHLTEAGEIFYEFLQCYQRDLDVTINRIKNRTDNLYQGTIRIGCPVSWNGTHFFDRLSAHFAINYPRVKLRLEGFGVKEVLDVLRSGELDVGLLYDFAIQHQNDISSKSFAQLDSGLLFSSSRYRDLDLSAGLSAFRNEYFLISENDGGALMTRQLTSLCSTYGFAPKVKYCRRLPTALQALTCGEGVMFADEWSIERTNTAFEYLPLPHQLPVRLIYTARNMTPLKSLFINETMYLFSK